MLRVIVTGGGIAALETLAGLATLAPGRVEATLVAPVRDFSYRPLSTAAPFTRLGRRTRALADLASELGARHVRDGLADVDCGRGRVLTHDGAFLGYDALVVAVGARRREHAGGGWAWHGDDQSTAAFGGLLRELEDGEVDRVAFVVPAGPAWPVDAYELALVAALAAGRGPGARITLVTAESAPLEAFGSAAAEAVAGELADAGVELRTGTEVAGERRAEEAGRDAYSAMVSRVATRPGEEAEGISLVLSTGRSLRVDRAVFLPSVLGPFTGGLQHDERGFLPVDEHGRVAGSETVHAAGDVTQLSLKHSSLAAAQGAAVAESLAALAGAEVEPSPWSPLLHGLLMLPPHFAAERGSPWLPDGEPLTHCLWWPPGHVAGPRLGPLLARRDPGLRPRLEWHPNGIPLTVSAGSVASAGSGPPGHEPSEEAARNDSILRQLLALRRAEREGEALDHELERRRGEFDRMRDEVVARLEAAGYLSHD